MKEQEDYMNQIRLAIENQKERLVKDFEGEGYSLDAIERVVFSVDNLVDSFQQDNFALEDEQLEELRDLQWGVVTDVYYFCQVASAYERETFKTL